MIQLHSSHITNGIDQMNKGHRAGSGAIISLSISLLMLSSLVCPAAQPGAIELIDPHHGAAIGYNSLVAPFGDDLLVMGVRGKPDDVPLEGAGLWDGQQWQSAGSHLDYGLPRFSVQWRGKLIVGGNAPGLAHRADGDIPDTTGLTAFDGRVWRPVSPEFLGRVAALAVYKDQLVVAGYFQLSGEPAATRIASWDGRQWTSLDAPPVGVGGSIRALTVHQGRLIAGGTFSLIGDTPAINLAAWDGQQWQDLGANPNARISNLASFRDELYIAGDFTCLGGQDLGQVARWDGTHWRALGRSVPFALPNPRGTPWVRMLATDTGLIFYGRYASVVDQAAPGLARWDGHAWHTDLPRLELRGTSRRTNSRVSDGGLAEPPPDRSRKRPESQPRAWNYRPPRVREAFSQPYSPEQLMLWRGRLLAVGEHHSDIGRDTVVLTLTTDHWQTIFRPGRPQPRRWPPVAVYCGQKLVTGDVYPRGRFLMATVSGDSVTPLGQLADDESRPGFVSVTTRGDSIFALGDFHHFSGQSMNHVTVYDGQQWLPIGQGLPFDIVHDGTILAAAQDLFVAGRFSNVGYQVRQALLHWDGQRWQMIDGDLKSLQVATDGHDIYTVDQGSAVRAKRLVTPDGEIMAGLRHNSPRILRWQDGQWRESWRGQSGRISHLTRDGNQLWALIQGSDEGLLLRLDQGHWQFVTAAVPRGRTGSLGLTVRSFGVHAGTPILLGGFWCGSDEPLATAICFAGGRWRALPLPERVWFPRSALTPDGIWLGGGYSVALLPTDLSQYPILPTRSIAELTALRAASKPYEGPDRQVLDFPWPNGVPNPGDQTAIVPGKRVGWFAGAYHYYEYPTAQRTVTSASRRGDTLVLKPYADKSGTPDEDDLLRFEFDLEPDRPLHLTFEYRFVNPLAWTDSWSLPRVWWRRRLRDISRPTALRPVEAGWNQFSGRAKGLRRQDRVSIVISPGETQDGAGQLEIRNLRLQPEEFDDKQWYKEIRTALNSYRWPATAAAALDTLVENARQRRLARPYREPGKPGIPGLTQPGGPLRFVAAATDNPATGRPDVRQELAALVGNWQHAESRQGWLAGGGLYIAAGATGYLRQIATSFKTDKRLSNLVHGVVWDLRHSGPYPRLAARKVFARTQAQFSILVSDTLTWAQLEDPSWRTPDAVTFTVKPDTVRWPDIPIVALVGPGTPGHLVMLLNAVPGIRTVGRPSAPVMVPTTARMLSDGTWIHVPDGFTLDSQGADVSLTAIEPEIIVAAGAEFDVAVRLAMELLGIKPDQGPQLCPWQ